MEYGFAKTETGKNIVSYRYLAPGESPDLLLRRVAREISLGDTALEDTFYEMMYHGKFLPNSPCLANAGRNNGNGLFACFVLGMEDNLESIAKAKADAMAITKSGGGWGINIGSLRPQGARVSGSTHGIAGGPIGFLETFSYDARTMTQGGFRDAACMATMEATHPDIYKFIQAKRPGNSIKRLLNLDKLRIDGDRYDATATELLKNPVISAASETYLSNFNISVLVPNEVMQLATAIGGDEKFPLRFDNVKTEEVHAGNLLLSIAEGMRENGEPGILFIDTIRKRTRYNPEEINATNPCGEQALPPNGSCCLGSINLAAFVENGALNTNKLEESIRNGVRFLDNMIDANSFPTKETREWARKNRAIGLGIMGYADMLILLGMKYGSKEALEFTEEIARFINNTAYNESINLYRMYDYVEGEGWGDGELRRRNRALLTIAPTGSISILAGCSPGIEPIYSKNIRRVDTTGEHLIDHPLSDMPDFVTLDNVKPEAIIDTVAVWSKYIDNSISYTVNVKNDATTEEILKLIFYAWKRECNGITVYRDGSRKMQVLHSSDAVMKEKKKRPKILSGNTFRARGQVDGKVETVYVTLNYGEDGSPFEVFVNTPHIKSMQELQLLGFATRFISLALRHNIPIPEILDQLGKIEGQSLTSIPAVIASILNVESDNHLPCPECDGNLIMAGGCNTCEDCGYSKCG